MPIYNTQRLFLGRIISEIRANIDEPSLNAKYSDNQLLSKIQQSYVMVLAELNRNAQSPIVCTHTIPVQPGVSYYPLPAHIWAVHAVYEETVGGLRVFYTSSGRHSVSGPGVRLEGSQLVIPSGIAAGALLTVEYTPSGAADFHMGILTSASFISQSVIELPPQSQLIAGVIDTRPHAYAGSLIRIVAEDGYSRMEERIIQSYDRDTRRITLYSPVSSNVPPTAPDIAFYEIAPVLHAGLEHSIGLHVSRWIAAVEGHSDRDDRLRRLYLETLRNIRLMGFYSKLDESIHQRADSYDLRRYHRRL